MKQATPRAKVVTLGGGHGLYAMLSALKQLPVDITAVVTVADDGGSSGRLRHDLAGILPPGDLRMALAALADGNGDSHLFTQTFQHRFAGQGALTGHPVGNIMLVGLMQVLNDPVAALDAAGRLLHARGRVLPLSCEPLDIVAAVSGLDENPQDVRHIRGQVAVAATPGRVRSVQLVPDSATACSQALVAIESADLVTLGPGSWFTSVLPHLMMPDLLAVLQDSRAHRLVALNLVAQPGETEGFSPEQHLHTLRDHAPDLRIDTVLADSNAVPLPDRLATAAGDLGAKLLLREVAAIDRVRHDPAALAAALAEILL